MPPNSKNRAVDSGYIYTSDNNLVSKGDDIRGNAFNIGRGLYPGAQPFSAYGERTAVAAEIDHPIWPDGIAIVVPPVEGIQMTVQSTSANDSILGTNIRSVTIEYLDSNLDPKSELIEMDGITPVTTVATDIRFIQCLHITTVGTVQKAAGDITAEGPGNIIYSIINTGQLRCSSSFRMVPRGKILYFDGAAASSVSGTAAATALIRIVATELEQTQYLYPHLFIPQGSIGVQDGAVSLNFPIPFGFQPGTIVGAYHTVSKAATTSITWFGRLEPIEHSGFQPVV